MLWLRDLPLLSVPQYPVLSRQFSDTSLLGVLAAQSMAEPFFMSGGLPLASVLYPDNASGKTGDRCIIAEEQIRAHVCINQTSCPSSRHQE